MRYVTGNCKPFLDLLFPAAVGDFSPLERPTEGRHQLVLQFQAESVQEFDELVVLEDLLVEKLPLDSEVDGHYFGSGECNIFIYSKAG